MVGLGFELHSSECYTTISKRLLQSTEAASNPLCGVQFLALSLISQVNLHSYLGSGGCKVGIIIVPVLLLFSED